MVMMITESAMVVVLVDWTKKWSKGEFTMCGLELKEPACVREIGKRVGIENIKGNSNKLLPNSQQKKVGEFYFLLTHSHVFLFAWSTVTWPEKWRCIVCVWLEIQQACFYQIQHLSNIWRLNSCTNCQLCPIIYVLANAFSISINLTCC